jgi:hypothetical protein
VDFHWFRVHWFELSALLLLGLNFWFVVKVLSVLRAVQDSLMLLARWLDIARSEVDRPPSAVVLLLAGAIEQGLATPLT